MCGRFVLFTSDDSLLAAAGRLPGVREVHAPQGLPAPRYNIAPTHKIPLLLLDGSVATLHPARWGLIPHWKKDDSGPPLFNARGESVATKPSFRQAFKVSRGLIPMDGYYEWHDAGQGKQPYFVTLGEGTIMWAAALWSKGTGILSTTMVTTAAIEPMAWLHDRLPRLLTTEEIPVWLSGSPEQAQHMLHPTNPDYLAQLEVRPVDKAVGNVANDYPKLITGAT